MKVGFVGFGEAAGALAAGLHEEGIQQLFAYDVLAGVPEKKQSLLQKASASGVKVLESPESVCREAEIVFAAVPAAYALKAAEQATPGLSFEKTYVDVSTARPEEKIKIANLVHERQAKFVDGAMMGTLLRDRHKVPMLLSGDGADDMIAALSPYHMVMKKVGDAPGKATSIKFIRSITAKGIACLLIESLEAAQRYGVEEAIVSSLCDSYSNIDFEKDVIDGYVSGSILHANRRAHELENVVSFLEQSSLPCEMSKAIYHKLNWLDEQHVRSRFDTVPRNWRGILEKWGL